MLGKDLLAAAVTAIVGTVVDTAGAMPRAHRPEPPVKLYPLPHLIPKYPGGVDLRLAMVHDLIHERYPKHGSVYYTQRDREVRAELAKLEESWSDSQITADRYFALLDDLGSGLDRLGDDDEAVNVLHAKLRHQPMQGRKGSDLYTTFANLGTFLIHGRIKRAMQGDAEAKARLSEELQFIRRSIEVNPEAHFGREIWQAVAVEFQLAECANLKLLLQYDPAHPERRGYGFAYDDQRPTLTLTYPHAGANPPLTRLLVGIHDYYRGLDRDTFRVVADFAIDGVAAGQDLTAKFRPSSPGLWELKLSRPIARLAKGKIDVSVKDRHGNVTCIERTFSVGSR